MSDKLKVDIGIYEDLDGDEDLGFFRGPMVRRRPGESYKDFRKRLQTEVETLVNRHNAALELKAEVTRSHEKLKQLAKEAARWVENAEEYKHGVTKEGIALGNQMGVLARRVLAVIEGK